YAINSPLNLIDRNGFSYGPGPTGNRTDSSSGVGPTPAPNDGGPGDGGALGRGEAKGPGPTGEDGKTSTPGVVGDDKVAQLVAPPQLLMPPAVQNPYNIPPYRIDSIKVPQLTIPEGLKLGIPILGIGEAITRGLLNLTTNQNALGLGLGDKG